MTPLASYTLRIRRGSEGCGLGQWKLIDRPAPTRLLPSREADSRKMFLNSTLHQGRRRYGYAAPAAADSMAVSIAKTPNPGAKFRVGTTSSVGPISHNG